MTLDFSVAPIIENILLKIVLPLLPCYYNSNALRFFGSMSAVLRATPATEVIM